MKTRHWSYAYPAKIAFEQMDRMRRWRGTLLDSVGFAPQEAPFRMIHAEAGIRLRSYGDASDDGPALLIVPAPIKRSYIWDLSPATSVVRNCLAHGLRTYMVEWVALEESEPDFGLDDYAGRLLAACVDAIATDCGQALPILCGHSLGGTLAAIFSCLYPQRVRALILLESPLHFGAAAGKFAPLVAALPDTRPIAEGFGNVPGSFLNAVSAAASPSEFQWQRYMDFSACLADRHALATHMRVERWTHDEFPLPGKLFSEIIERLYRGDELMQGTLAVAGRRAGPAELTMPLLDVVDRRSTIIPPQSIIPFHEAAAASLKELLFYEGDVGVAIQHVGVLVGTNARMRIWPAIFEWLSMVCPDMPRNKMQH